ncbi:cytochrome P450 [Streptomyces sp. NPDC101062]|uniref:Herg n=1 Tax=Streptomyces chromofuscus TaxID=42881 RepID=H6UNZ9_STRCW|nr:Herg [Streptomyces chromofuscus]
MTETCPARDLYTPAYFKDPYPALTRLRDAGPVHRVERPDGLVVWLITRYAEAQAALGDPRLSMDGEVVQKALGAFAYGYLDPENEAPHTLLSSDPPDHTRLRRLVNRTFTARRIQALRPRVQELMDGLLDALGPDAAHADLIEAVAAPLPIAVICELLGVPPEDYDSFKLWTTTMFVLPADVGDGMSPTDAMRNLRRYLSDLIAAKRAERPETGQGAAGTEESGDLLSALIAVRDTDEGRLSEHELVSMAVQLLIAGHETTVNGIGNAVLNLLRHPEQLAALRAEPALLPRAVDELLRFEGPLETAILRVATEPIPLGDQVVPAGALVKVVLAAANRDPDRFAAPDTLDITRKNEGHLQFGHGIHNCLGAFLARMETEIAISSLLRRYPGLSLGVPEDEIRWREIAIMRALAELPVTLTGPV